MKEVAFSPETKARPANARLEAPRSVKPSQDMPWRRFISRVRSWFEIPFGYEDENGFHYGHEPAPRPTPRAEVLTDRACDAMLSPAPAADIELPQPRQTVGSRGFVER